MDSKPTSPEIVGVVGAGSFGSVIANLIAPNKPVLLYARRPEVVEALRRERRYKHYEIRPEVKVTSDLAEVARRCTLIFPVVPSENFRDMIQELAPHLSPAHMLIHATKGLDVQLSKGQRIETIETLKREQIKTISELIRQETVVLRVGCIAGPNLAAEIAEGQPAATVVASHFDEVIREGQAALRSGRFRVHGNHELLGIELAGVLKNIMAIAAGALHGLGYGDNTRALLITRGMAEMVYVGKGLGAEAKAFLGLAGIGDLVATCSSMRSRNFTVGYRLARGETLDQILTDMEEIAEGVKTVCIVRALAAQYKIPAPITQVLYKVMFEGLEVERGMTLLMEYPFREDVEFL